MDIIIGILPDSNILWPSRYTIFLSILFLLFIISKFKYLLTGRLKFTSGTVSVPWGIGNFQFEVSEREKIIAWKMYVQLKSRKAAIPFDERYDLIDEVYNSLYELFKINRELLTDLPLDDIRRSNSLAELQMQVLNEGLRPHLTRWQAQFKSWWKKELNKPENENLTPQEIQRKFPQYDDLVNDIKELNSQLEEYSLKLLEIARSR